MSEPQLEASAIVPGEHPVDIAEIGMHMRDLENRAISLYFADAAKIGNLRDIFEQARDSMDALLSALKAVKPEYECPAGTVRCPRGCCYPTWQRL